MDWIQIHNSDAPVSLPLFNSFAWLCGKQYMFFTVLCLKICVWDHFSLNLQWTQMMQWGATQASCPPPRPHRLVRMGRRLGALPHSLPLCPPPCLELGMARFTSLINKHNVAFILCCVLATRWWTIRNKFLCSVSDFACFSSLVLHVRAARWWGSRWTTGHGKAQRRRRRGRRETLDWRTPWRVISVHFKSAASPVEGSSPLRPAWPWLLLPRRRTRKVRSENMTLTFLRG